MPEGIPQIASLQRRRQTAADDAYTPPEFPRETSSRFFVADRSRLEHTQMPTLNNLQRIQKIIDVRRQQRRVKFAANRVDRPVAANHGMKNGFFFLQPGFQFPVE